MPRIPTLQQGTRLQVSSPVPIGSSQGARAEGEAIQQFGNDLQKTGLMLAEFSQAAKKSSSAVQLANVSEDADSAALKSKNEALQKSKADGSDTVEVYEKRLDEKIQPMLNSIADPELRAQAEVAVKQRKNAQLASLYKESTERTVTDLAVQSQVAVGKAMANTFADPYSAPDRIKDLQFRLIQDNGLYDQAAKQIKIRDDSQAIAISAVDGLIEKNKYDEARTFLKDSLSGFFDPKTLEKKLVEIGDKQDQFNERVLRESYQVERRGSLAHKEQAADLTNQYFSASVNAVSSEERAQAVKFAQRDLADGKISPKQYKMIADYSTGLEKSKYTITADFTRKITDAGTDPSAVADAIHDEVVAGRLSANQATQLMNMDTQRRAMQRKSPDMRIKYQVSDDYVVRQFKGLDSAPFPNGAESAKLDVLSRKDALVNSGVDPITASKRALQAVVPRPETLPSIPGYSGAQNTSKDLVEAEKFLKDRNKQRGKMAPAEVEIFIQQAQAYKAKKASVQIHEEQVK